MQVKALFLSLVMVTLLMGCTQQETLQQIVASATPQPKPGLYPDFEWARANLPEDAILEHAEGTLLTAETLPQLLKCALLSGMQNGVQVTLRYKPDQTVTMIWGGEILAEGFWWMEADLYCHNFGAAYGRSQCGMVLLNGNRLTWFDLEGFASMQFDFMER